MFSQNTLGTLLVTYFLSFFCLRFIDHDKEIQDTTSIAKFCSALYSFPTTVLRPLLRSAGIGYEFIGSGIAFSVLTATALTSLFESITQMEDPFVGYCTLDGVNVHRELVEELRAELLDCRKHYFPDAGPYLSTDRPPPHQATRER